MPAKEFNWSSKPPSTWSRAVVSPASWPEVATSGALVPATWSVEIVMPRLLDDATLTCAEVPSLTRMFPATLTLISPSGCVLVCTPTSWERLAMAWFRWSVSPTAALADCPPPVSSAIWTLSVAIWLVRVLICGAIALIWPSMLDRNCSAWPSMLLIVLASDLPCRTAVWRTDWSCGEFSTAEMDEKNVFIALLRFEPLFSAPTMFSSWL